MKLTEVTKFYDNTFENKDYNVEGLSHGSGGSYRFVHAGRSCYLIGVKRNGEKRCAVFYKNYVRQVYNLMELAPPLFLRI